MVSTLLVGSSLFVKLFTAGVFAVGYLMVFGLSKSKLLFPMLIAGLFIISRDLLSYLFGIYAPAAVLPIYTILDYGFIFCLFAQILERPFKQLLFLILLGFGILGSAATLSIALALPFIASIPVLAINAIPSALSIAFFLYCLNAFKDKKKGSPFLFEAWLPVGIIALFYTLSQLILGWASPIFQWICSPLVAVLPPYLAFLEFRGRNNQTVHHNAVLEDTLDSVFNFIRQTDQTLTTAADINELLNNVCETVVQELDADGGVVMLVDEFDDILEVKAYTGRFPPPFKIPEEIPRKPNRVELFMKHARISIGENVLGEVAESGKPTFIANAASDERVASNGNDDFLQVSSLIVTPLISGDKIMGILAVARKSSDKLFDETDFNRCLLLTDFASLSINAQLSFIMTSEKRGIEHEVSIAADIQKTLTPKKLQDFPYASFGSISVPARGICSDYFDVIVARKDLVAMVIGDVAGKGIAASLVMVMLRSILHLVANSNKDAATILSWVNRGITGRVDMDHFATLAYACFDPTTKTLEYSNAAHQPLIIYKAANATFESVELKSLPIGVEKKTEYTKKRITLENGDIAIMYTDGVTEAMNADGKQFGLKNLIACVQKHNALSAKDIANNVKAELQKFVGSARQHDDQTLLIMKVKL